MTENERLSRLKASGSSPVKQGKGQPDAEYKEMVEMMKAQEGILNDHHPYDVFTDEKLPKENDRQGNGERRGG